MRVFLFFLFLTLQTFFACAVDETTRFTPLSENERFAFTRQVIPLDPVGAQINITLYAVKDNNVEDISELFTWEDTHDTDSVQFTHDFRTVFFTVRQRDVALSGQLLYMADGSTGEVRRLPVEIQLPWRVTEDGRFVAFINPWRLSDEVGFRRREMEQANIFVFDIETETMTQLTWRTNRPITGGWSLYRFDNIFRIIGTFEGGFIGAIADLDPATMELKTLWDLTDGDSQTHPLPWIDMDNNIWTDDVPFYPGRLYR